MKETNAIALPLDAIRDYCAGQPIRRLSLFGSTLRGERDADSDVDLLVEYVPDARVGLFAMSRQQNELSAIVGGRVDLRTPNELSPFFRQDVVDSAQLIYESS